jgi:acetylornithine deacetylase
VTSALERQVAAEIAGRAPALTELLATLIGFDTRTPDAELEPRDEAALQGYLAERLGAAGLDVEIWEPDPSELLAGSYPIPNGYHFRGRPQLLARAAGTGGGRSLLLNGHIDVVGAEPLEAWTSDPFRAQTRDGRLYGRGACDMKAGVAAMVQTAEVLRALRVPLRGDLILNTVTDEESTGAGSLASIARGASADGGLIPEPTDLTAWLGTRGSLMATITVEGRAGHAAFPQEHWTAGGAVNAIEKMQLVLATLQALREEWRDRPELRHPYLRTGTIVPTSFDGGQWIVSYPARAALRLHVQYLPGQAGADGCGAPVRAEIEQRVLAAASADPWLRSHPPTFEWHGDAPPVSHDPDRPVCAATLEAMAALGLGREVGTRTTWTDAATFSRAGTPTVVFGPGSVRQAHAVDEFVPLDELVRAAQVMAVAAMRFCGVS